MKQFQRGTPEGGLALGMILVLLGALVMVIGFWKTLILALLFAIGYFIGGVDRKTQWMKDTLNKVIPEKKEENINFREELAREQENLVPEEMRRPAGDKVEE